MTPTRPTDGRIRVAVADDRARARRALIALLDTCPGLHVVGQASNGREAIDLVETSRPDVVLMDLRMPVMDGVEATRRLKRRWPGLTVLAVTMHPDLGGDALRAGADGVLLKELAAPQLARVIRCQTQNNVLT